MPIVPPDVLATFDRLFDQALAAGERGGHVLYSGPPQGLARVQESQTRRYLFDEVPLVRKALRQARGWLRLEGVTRNNLQDLHAEFPLGCLIAVTGVSGSGKSSLAPFIARALGWRFYAATVTARTQARDLMWEFDALRRLSDAQTRRVTEATRSPADQVAPSPVDQLEPNPVDQLELNPVDQLGE